jgi:hypothetical protein
MLYGTKLTFAEDFAELFFSAFELSFEVIKEHENISFAFESLNDKVCSRTHLRHIREMTEGK